MENFKINKGSTLYITQRLSPTPATHSMANAILRVMHIFALFGLDGGSIQRTSIIKQNLEMLTILDER